ncbi:MAG TPA: IS21 family transposase [Candidatus Methylomirabilis sp.]|nr:IS21 family transposase [Candidatus Methylomirabilis sp.]
MIREELWQEVHRLFTVDRWSKAAIGRELDLDVKTVRRVLQQASWQPYHRAPAAHALLTAHRSFLEQRAPAVGFSAQVLYQELVQQHGYPGSYQTVKRFVRPLREAQALAARATIRFETPPGLQSQIDWGQATVPFRSGRAVRHFFILTLGYSRRGFYLACRDEQLPTFLDAHERAFDHFGGHTKEHLYDRPRTVCWPTGEGLVWNPTFQAFAQYWGFDARLCRPYRAQTKGKVESGVKYLKRNFLVGRTFVDDTHLGEALLDWTTTIADQRIHGTTHERPIERFAAERAHLLPTAHQPAFRLEATYPRVVAEDFLVSLDTNRYSVPFRFIGRTVTVQRREGQVLIRYQGQLIAEHVELPGRHQLRLLPEHGPGAVARNARQPQLHAVERVPRPWSLPAVEVRDLAVYEACGQAGGGR